MATDVCDFTDAFGKIILGCPDSGLSEFVDSLVTVFVAVLCLSLSIWVVLQIVHRDNIREWRKFAAEFHAGPDARLTAVYHRVGGWAYVRGYRFLMFTSLTTNGLRLRKGYLLPRLVYPSVYLRWSQIASLTELESEFPKINFAGPQYANDIMASLEIVSPKYTKIDVPWSSDFSSYVPKNVIYIPRTLKA